MKGYVITLRSAPQAMLQYERFRKLAKKFNYDIEPYWAVEGRTITNETFSDLGLYLNPNTTIYKRRGAQGCFLSHWNLWHQCVEQDKPIMIFESDAYITDKLPELDFSRGLIKLHTDRGTKQSDVTGIWSKGAHAYALLPEHAQALIQGSLDTEVKPADKAIGDKFVPWYHLENNLVPQVRYGTSTTASKRST